jgi:hypothetical protein
MSDAEKPLPGASRPLSSAEEVRAAWDQFREGAVVRCARDGAHVALAVDATAGAYRLVCTRCGAASFWFESDPQGIRFRTLLPVRGASEAGDE